MQTLGGIDILMSALVKVVIQPAPVYWLPWSVFIISGLPYRAIASSNAVNGRVKLDQRAAQNVATLGLG
jgi:hypothetical protein